MCGKMFLTLWKLFKLTGLRDRIGRDAPGSKQPVLAKFLQVKSKNKVGNSYGVRNSISINCGPLFIC